MATLTRTSTAQVTVIIDVGACGSVKLPAQPERLREAGVLEEDFIMVCQPFVDSEKFKGKTALPLVVISCGVCVCLFCIYSPTAGVAPFNEKYKDKQISVQHMGGKSAGFLFTVPENSNTAPACVQMVRDAG